MSIPDVVIVAAARTPQGRLKGQLAPLTAVQLGSAAIRGALEQGGVAADAVDAVIVGQVLQAGAGQNPARQAAVGAGIPWACPRQPSTRCACRASTPIIDGARMIASATPPSSWPRAGVDDPRAAPAAGLARRAGPTARSRCSTTWPTTA